MTASKQWKESDMTIEERAEKYAQSFRYLDLEDYDDGLRSGRCEGYVKGATEQKKIDIEKFVEYAKSFNKQNEELGIEARIDVKSMRSWVSNIIC